MLPKLFTYAILLGSMSVLLQSQTLKDMPVYPNATLETSTEPGEEAVCCSFSTADPLSKVVAFYETALKSKALDIPALSKKYPAIKTQLLQMQQQMPPGIKYLAFIISDAGNPQTQGPVLFEIISGKGRTTFSLSEQDLGRPGAGFVYKFRKATGATDNLDQMYESWAASHPAAKQEQFDFPVYPGSLVEAVNAGGSDDMNSTASIKGEKCYYVTLCILDTLAFEKVTAFYKNKLKGKFTEMPAGDNAATSFEMEAREYYWKEAGGGMEEFHGKKGDVNRILSIQFAQSVPQLPYFDREQITRVAGDPLRCITVTFTSTMLGKCEEIPKETRRSMYQGGE